MATEVQSGDLDSATTSRLEVSIDGLTLSPDPEGEQNQVEEPNPAPTQPGTDTPADEEGEDGETAKSAIERKWGFPLLELYGLALKFFKGISLFKKRSKRFESYMQFFLFKTLVFMRCSLFPSDCG